MSTKSGMWDGYTTGAQIAVTFAHKMAKANGSPHIKREHFLAGILQTVEQYPQQPEVQLLSGALTLCGIKREELEIYINSTIEKIGEPFEGEVAYLDDISVAGKHINKEFKRSSEPKISLSHMFLGLIAPQKDSHLDKILAPFNLNTDELRSRLKSLKKQQTSSSTEHQFEINSTPARLTVKMEKTLDAAQSAMRATFCGRISILHLLLGILEDRDSRACEILEHADIDLDEFKTRVRQAIGNDNEVATAQKRYSKDAQRALFRAHLAANASKSRYVGTEHLLFAILPQQVPLKQLLTEKQKFGEVEDYRHIWTGYEVPKIQAVLSHDLNLTEASIGQSIRNYLLKGQRAILEFVLPVIIFALAIRWTAPSSPKDPNGDVKVVVLFSLLFLLVVCGFSAASIQLFSNNKELKERSLRLFTGILVGLFLGFVLASISVYKT